MYDAVESGNEINWLRLHLHGDIGAYLTPWFRLETRIKIEEAHDHGGHEEEEHHHSYGDKDRFFADHVAIIEELKATLSLGKFDFFGGKFNPVTGLDMHALPGQYGYEVIEEYSILERVGIGTRYIFDSDAFGKIVFEGTTFFADTTFLNEGFGEDRDVPHSQSDGGLANTESFESFAASIRGTGWYTAVGDTIHGVDWIVGAAY